MSLPCYMLGHNNINSVSSSSFVTALYQTHLFVSPSKGPRGKRPNISHNYSFRKTKQNKFNGKIIVRVLKCFIYMG